MRKRISHVRRGLIFAAILLTAAFGLLRNPVQADKAEDAAKQAKELVKKAEEATKTAEDAKKAADEAAKKAASEKTPEDQKAEEAAKAANDAAKAADDAADEAQKKQLEADVAAAAAKKAGGGSGEKSAEQVAADKAKDKAKDAEEDLADAEKESAEADKNAAAADKKIENRDVKKKKADARAERRKACAARRLARKKIREARQLLEDRKRREGTSPTKGSKELEKELEELGKLLGAPRQEPPKQGTVDPNKSAVADTAASSMAAAKLTVTHTNDWQPGDEVSFSFTGTVYGPTNEKQLPDDYTGTFVGIVDQRGNRTEIPWSKLIRYKVPEAATSVIASLIKPDRTIISTTSIPVNPKGTNAPIQLPPNITGHTVAYPVHQIGQPFTIYSPAGRFSGDANKIRIAITDKINNTTHASNAVAASPRSALFSPQVKEPGSYAYTVSDDGRFEESFDISAVGIKLDTSRAYRVNQQGTLVIVVALPPSADAQEKLLSDNFHVTTEMETPNVLAFASGKSQILWPVQKSEISNNLARKEFPVIAGVPGTFKITALGKTPGSVNPSTTKTGGRPGVLGPNVFYKPGDPEKDPCAKLREELEKLKKELADKEAEAAGLPKEKTKVSQDLQKSIAELNAGRNEQKKAADDLAKKAAKKKNIENNIGNGKTFPDKDAAKKNFGDYEKEHADAKKAKDAADKKVADAQKKQDDLKNKADELGAKEKTLPGEIEDLKRKIGETEQALRECEDAEKKKQEEAEKPKEEPTGGTPSGANPPTTGTGGNKPPPCIYGSCAWLITVATGTGLTEVDHSAVSIDGKVFSMEGKGMVEYPDVCAYIKRRVEQEGRSISVNPILYVDKVKMNEMASRIKEEQEKYHLFCNNCALNAWKIMKAGGSDILEEPKPQRLQKRGEDLGALGPRKNIGRGEIP